MDMEVYVNLETAKKLKQSGFNIPCHMCYDLLTIPDKLRDNFGYSNHNKHGDLISAPTLAVVHRWIRETYNHYIQVLEMSSNGGGWGFKIHKINSLMSGYFYSNYDSYEQALENGINMFLDKCLKQLIKINNIDIETEYMITLSGEYTFFDYICPNCDHAVYTSKYKHIIGFSYTDYGIVKVIECPECHTTYYSPMSEDEYTEFLKSIEEGTQKHFVK